MPAAPSAATDDDGGGQLGDLAAAYGVAMSYEDYEGRRVAVAADTVVRVLAELGVDASTPAAVRGALEAAELAPWRQLLPPTVVVRQSRPATVAVHAPVRTPPALSVRLEDGTRRALPPVGEPRATREVDGTDCGSWEVALPDLPLGWHHLQATAGGDSATATLVAAPDRVPEPAGLNRQGWGWMVQLYSVRSRRSWGMGDFGDLAELAAWSGREHGAAVVVCNPLHAVPPVPPIVASPYSPASRRFVNPVYLRIEEVPEYAQLDPTRRTQVEALATPARAGNGTDRIERDTVWVAKLAALELVAAVPRSAARADELAAYEDREGPGLADFALWSALVERYGRRWQDWPADLHRPDGPGIAAAREELADRVRFHAWLQFLCDEQLAAAQAAAIEAGMPLGLVHDLAVGVDPGGADAWSLQDFLAGDVRVGAPPDSFNQQGQNWGLPPWRPDRLAQTGYAPYRDMLRALLRHAGGVRIDHILGLFRLWWIPPDAESAGAGTYVRYDDEALLGVLALEAQRAGAVVVGEDLGTVEPRVRAALGERGVLGSAVLWFEREEAPEPAAAGDRSHGSAEGGEPGPAGDRGPVGSPPVPRRLPPARWRRAALASVTTHDLPTAAGFLASEHVRVRAELGQLGRPVEQEQAQADADRADLLALLRDEGLVGAEPTTEETVLAMHALLTRTPCRLVVAALGDAVGDLRQPNLPGTFLEYPNWCLPVAAPGPRDVMLEELESSPRVARLAEVLRTGRLPGAAGGG